MNELVTKLGEKISAGASCGPDLSNDFRLTELEELLRGKPEVELGSLLKPAEPPDWRQLQQRSIEFLKESKHLRVGVVLSCCWLQTGGVAGFRDGVQLLRGWLENYWSELYPLLDPEDNNDPTQRLNIIGALTAPRGQFQEWLRILDYLYTAPLLRPSGIAPISFEQLKEDATKSAGAGGPLMSAARQDGGQEAALRFAELEEAAAEVKKIDEFLTATLGSGGTISFAGLSSALAAMLGVLKPLLAAAETEPAAAAQPSGGPAVAVQVVVNAVAGPIQSREDVVKALDRICEYYRQAEPGSPVPFILKRARKLANMNFIQVMEELSLATPDSLRPIMGSALGSTESEVSTPT